ncbi:S-layer homology domain-containing protein [Paenibacillus oceani]|uniref:S-layer homology domain-containing protein n=1 Tax=Paenibacillus oceani TaxID=2772510 RepID=UPI001CC230BA|nr:S-layer homology domain-containing protein [Paenibacillus oceani]
MPTYQTLNSVVYGNSMYVAVGDMGTIVTSPDGVSWTNRSPVSTSTLYGVTYNSGKYVAVGVSGTILTSTDGVTWTRQTSNQSTTIYSVTYGSGKFVAVGANGMALTSTDGVSWNSHSSGTTEWYTTVSYGNGKFTAAGGRTIVTSSDGVSWTSSSSGASSGTYLYGTAYGNDKYVAVGDKGTIATSTNGTSWTSTASVNGINTTFKSVIYINGQFVVVGFNGTVMTSLDGISWNTVSSNQSYSFYAVTFNNGMYVSVGYVGMIRTSSDGTNWTSRTEGTLNTLNAVAYDNGKYVAVGAGGAVMTSDDGVSWNSSASGTINNLKSADYGNGIHVAVGSLGTIVTSSDRASWTSAASNTTNELNGVTFGGDKYVAVGNSGTILTSDDAGTWTSVTSGVTNSLRGIAFGSGKYVAVGDSGTIVTSSDGAAWTKVTISATNSFTSITYGNGMYVAVGYSRVIMTSSDGEIWTTATSGTPFGLGSVAYGNGLYVVVGAAGIVLVSSDGVTWTIGNSGAPAYMTGVAGGSGMFVEVGGNGMILAAETVLNAQNNRIIASKNSTAEGDQVELTAIGDRQLAAGLEPGSEKYIPTVWTSTESGQTGTFSLSGASYKSTYTPLAAGDYTVTATFLKQTWDGIRWVNTAITDTKTTTVTVNVQVDAQSPIISTQPGNQSVSVGDIASLNIMAAVSDGGTLSYQWYSNTTNSTSGGTAIDGATSASYSAPTNGAGTTYYYAVVTNTNNSVTGSKTAAATSSVAVVTVNGTSIYSIAPIANQTAVPLVEGYASGSPETLSIEITNTGTGHLTHLTAALNGANANDFVITQPNPTLNSGAPATSFTVKAKDGLTAGTYTATVTVSADQMTDVTFTVTQVVSLPNTTHPLYLTASGGDRQIALHWNTVSGATYYNLFMSTVSNPVSYTSIATVSGSTYNVHNLTNGTTYYFIAKAGNLGGWIAESNQAYATPATAPELPSDDTGNSGVQTPSVPVTPPTTDNTKANVDVLVNGKLEKAGTASTTRRNDQTVTTITIDPKNLNDRLAQEGQRAVVTIPVNAKSDVIVGELNGQMIKNMENKQAVLEIKTDRATYTLPAQQINMDFISNQLGNSIDLQDIQIQIEIGSPAAELVRIVENAADQGSFTWVVPPIDFTVKAVHKGVTIAASKFNAYVERTITIPDDVDPTKITTGVVIEPDGTVRHVPTKIVVRDGNYYAIVNSLTNSLYSVVWNKVEFQDVRNHWAKHAVNDMASRMVISGISKDEFSPDRDITRAEFAAIIVRGLGLKPETQESPFEDVQTTDWYSGVIHTAYEYKLIDGFEDKTFRPNDKITREQAMVILAKAMTITDLKAKLPASAAERTILAYQDASDASAWALGSIADIIQAGIVSGRNGAELAPKAYITRAEVATILQRLLQQSDLI